MKTSARALPVAGILGSCLFLIGLSAAAVAPYRAIVAIDHLGMSNGLYALVMTLGSVATALGSLVMGYFADRISDRRRLVLISALMGALAYGLIYLLPSQLVYVVAICAVLPLGGSLFSQTFSFSRVYFDRYQPERAAFMVSVLRTLFSAAWIAVPPLAGWLAAQYSVFDVFAAAALAHVVFVLTFGTLLLNPKAKIGVQKNETPASEPISAQLPLSKRVGMGGVLLVRTAMFLHGTTIPLALVNDFGGTLATVGLNASIAAGLEIPFMLAWGWAAGRVSKETILSVSALVFTLYLFLVFRAETVPQVLWLQGLNALALSALLSITISYMQEAIRGRVGLSTSLMDVVSVLASTLAAGLFALFADEASYRSLFAVAGLLSLGGALVIGLSRRLEKAGIS